MCKLVNVFFCSVFKLQFKHAAQGSRVQLMGKVQLPRRSQESLLLFLSRLCVGVFFGSLPFFGEWWVNGVVFGVGWNSLFILILYYGRLVVLTGVYVIFSFLISNVLQHNLVISQNE